MKYIWQITPLCVQGTFGYRCGSEKRRGKSRFVEKERGIRSRLDHSPGAGCFQRPVVTVGLNHQLSCATCSASPAVFAAGVFVPLHSEAVCQAPEVPRGVCPVPRMVAHPCQSGSERQQGEELRRNRELGSSRAP